jgi:hypothetical protein
VPKLQVRLPRIGGRVTGGGPDAGVSAGSGTTPTFSDHGGPVLDHAQLQLIFWGGAWDGVATPAAAEVTDAVRAILGSPYMSGLAEYRGIGPAALHGSFVASGSDPPQLFSNDQVATFLKGLIQGGSVPEPDEVSQLVYVVVMPPGVSHQDQSLIGEHSYFWYWDVDLPLGFDVARAHYAWVTCDGTLDSVTTILSHELVEVVTDPEGSAVTGSSCSAAGWCEIGDVCESSTGSVGGVTVQAYWSELASACVIPGSP